MTPTTATTPRQSKPMRRMTPASRLSADRMAATHHEGDMAELDEILANPAKREIQELQSKLDLDAIVAWRNDCRLTLAAVADACRFVRMVLNAGRFDAPKVHKAIL